MTGSNRQESLLCGKQNFVMRGFTRLESTWVTWTTYMTPVVLFLGELAFHMNSGFILTSCRNKTINVRSVSGDSWAVLGIESVKVTSTHLWGGESPCRRQATYIQSNLAALFEAKRRIKHNLITHTQWKHSTGESRNRSGWETCSTDHYFSHHVSELIRIG